MKGKENSKQNMTHEVAAALANQQIQTDRENVQKKMNRAAQMTVYTTGYFVMYSHEAFNLSICRGRFSVKKNQKGTGVPFRVCRHGRALVCLFAFSFLSRYSFGGNENCRRRFQSIVT